MAVETPHFAIPFRMGVRSFLAVEQDTDDDIISCVYNLLLTRVGEREMNPDFGSPEFVFQTQPLDVDRLIDIIAEFEPRAIPVIQQSPDLVDKLVTNIQVAISRRESE